MTKDILVSIKGLQTLGEDQEDEIEVIIPGHYCKLGETHYVKYDEVAEGLEGSTKNLIKFNDTSMEVTKKGLTNTHMIFEKQKKNTTYYDTPYGNLLLGISATNITMQETDRQIDVRVDYALEINEQHMADCSIGLSVRPSDEIHII